MGGRVRVLRNLAVVVILTGVAVAGVWQATRLKSDVTHAGARTTDMGTGVTLYPGQKGIPLPALKGRTINGDTRSLHDLRGHVVVLNVWGSWCAPCRAEAPVLATVSADVATQGVRFVGIDVRDNPAAGRAFERSFNITYPSFDDQNGLVLAQFTGIIPVSAVPSTVVADRSGVIRGRVVGTVDARTLRGLIRDAEHNK